MKKIMAVLIIAIVFLTGCNQVANVSSDVLKETEPNNASVSSRGVWFSFSELNAMLNSPDGFKNQIDKAVINCSELKIDNVYIHVRSYSDSLFKSEYFPLIEEAKSLDFDAFDYIITAFHNKGIKVHAWINPYRVTTKSTDIEVLDPESPARKWLTDDNPDNDINVIKYNGMYLNPAEPQVRELVINGIREILNKYKVDGIHFDDYFYPTTDKEFDSASYDKYCETAVNPLELGDWRRSNVNALISSCYTAVKFYDKNIMFSVSPMASIEKNYDELYADVKAWIKSGCIDYIIPQLYFGFNYPDPSFSFNNLLDEWKNAMKLNKDVGLVIGLGPYKIGTDSEADKEEWQNDNDIISKQAKICYDDKKVSGYVLFSYTSLFSDNELNSQQRENLKEYIKSCK